MTHNGDDAQRLSAALAEIDEQREKGWPDFGPEAFCHRCGGRNVSSWYVDSDRFNMACGPPAEHQWNGIICPGCFVQLHEQATGMCTTWALVPDPNMPFRWIEDLDREQVPDLGPGGKTVALRESVGHPDSQLGGLDVQAPQEPAHIPSSVPDHALDGNGALPNSVGETTDPPQEPMTHSGGDDPQ